MILIKAVTAIISVWVITIVAITSICKIAGFPLPFMDKIPSWEWLELAIKIFGLIFE